MRLATSSCCSCNPGCQERRSITHALLPAALPMRFLTADCKPAKQERHTKSTNVCAALTMETIPRYSEHASFFTCIICNRPLATIQCAFFWPHLPEVLRRLNFIEILKCKSSSCHSPVHFLSATFPDRAANPRKYLGDPRSHTTQKRQVSRPMVFSPVNSHASELLHFPTAWWWVVDMMMWLRWWWGRHDDVVDMMVGMLTISIVCNSEVF